MITRTHIAHVGLPIAVLAAIFICVAKPAHAQNVSSDLLLETPSEVDTTSFTISQNESKNWKGRFQLPNQSSLQYNKTSLKKLASKQILGTKNETTASMVNYGYNPASVYAWVEKLAPLLRTEPAEPSLTISNNRAIAFVPPQSGQRLNTYETTKAILAALDKGQSATNLIADEVLPKKQLKELNDLGINELIGHGVSTFSGSPKNRRHNIRVGVEKETGIIIAPGEQFSFNKYLGPVEAYTGFLPELVIKKTGTVPEFGGGLCQVSSTTFRAAMDAGLPITERRNHSYAVQYYAPQGTDATIYPGVQDLKFTNDTQGHILIWPYFKDDNTLIFDIYGTKDDRQVTIEKPVQYDRKSDGSMKAYWNRTVVKDGVEKKDHFTSVYQPPALFHKQEEFAPAAPPATTPTDSTSTPPTTPAPAQQAPTNTNQAN
jgi:vancomycin resistance protein YoaR